MSNWKRLVHKHLEDQRGAGWARGTLERSVRWLKKFLLWCNSQGLSSPAQVTPAHIAEYRQYLLCVPGRHTKVYTLNSVAQALTVVRQFFYWATLRGHLLMNPTEALVLPRIETHPPQLTVAEVEKLLEVTENGGTPAGLRDRTVLETIYRGGVRRKECLQLLLTDVDLAGRQLRVVGRGGHERTVPIADPLALTLERYLRDSRPKLAKTDVPMLFLSGAGTPYNEGTMGQMIIRVNERSQVRFSAHVLRHACAAHMLEAGADFHQVQQLLGHRHPQSTAHAYADTATAALARKRRTAQWQRPLTNFSSLVDGSDDDWSAILNG